MDEDFKTFLKWAGGIVGSIVLLVAIVVGIGRIPQGFIGIRTTGGAVTGTKNAGYYAIIPFIQGMELMDTQTQKEQVDATAASADLQNVTATVAINFHVNPQDASTIYSTIGADYQSRVIDPAIQESIKSITANYTAEQLITSREKVREEILALLTTKLQAYGVNTDSLNIVNFAFSDTFNSAIEKKVTAEQDALAAKNKLAQVDYEAKQRVTQAKGEAEAIAIQAQAINSQGGSDYVALQWIKAWQAGGSQVPQFITSSQGSSFLMDLSGMKK